ncbi:30S ribosomal protein S6 [Thermogemmatispora tikiterensis]|uniref:Small ribosomal subunit protein bS6 n=1 Tax=Thermogemmatispora tikiterensis TaxID=1825093 RepID=A0A328VJR7_9CHLR|nr:30S ribosomal protein S6 [Thermogemmatispora tikiterensis]RAQ97329.1 30S ribosomal protein S6 [Thermogemmatispora tikiterensis]
MRRDYELGFILHPEVSEERTRTILERIEQIVTAHDGQVVRVNYWGRRRLAYPIEHHRDGIYVFVDMSVSPETLPELDRTLKVSEEVLRHLIKRRDPRVVQKEREAYAAASAAGATPAPAPASVASEELAGASAEAEVAAAGSAPEAEAEAEAPAEAPEAAALSESSESESSESAVGDQEAPAVSHEEMESAPPALDEQPAPASEAEQA